jgi:hypothetical protein
MLSVFPLAIIVAYCQGDMVWFARLLHWPLLHSLHVCVVGGHNCGEGKIWILNGSTALSNTEIWTQEKLFGLFWQSSQGWIEN